MDQSDPFLQAQNDLQSLLYHTTSLLESHNRILRTLPPTSSTSTNPELLQTRSDLSTSLTDLRSDLQDLRDSVKAIEDDPYRFGLEIEEVSRRRKWVDEINNEIEDLGKDVQKATSSTSTTTTTRNATTGRNRQSNGNVKSPGLPDPDAYAHAYSDDEYEEDDDNFAAYEQERQEQILADQDEQLDGVFKTVGNLRYQADEMGRELEEQGELLEDVDSVADRVGGKLQDGLKKVGKVIRDNEERGSGWCIGILIFVLIILLVVLLIS